MYLKAAFLGLLSALVVVPSGFVIFNFAFPVDDVLKNEFGNPSLTGPYVINGHLDQAEKLFEDQIKGPECFDVYKNELYFSIHGGKVVKLLKDGSLKDIVKFGQDCEGFWEEEKCGRPLGLKFDSKGNLIVADAYYGLFKVNVNTGKYEQLASRETVINGKKPKLPNSVAIAKDDTIYWTDSSTSHSLYEGLSLTLGPCDGRVIKYDPKTKTNTVIYEGLCFANGIALSPDESYVFVSESFKHRIVKVYVKGNKAGTTEVAIPFLPGVPDNIQVMKGGQYAVTLVFAEDDQHTSFITGIHIRPALKSALSNLVCGLRYLANKLYEVYPHYYTKRISHMVGHFESLPQLNNRATVVIFNEKGPVRSLHSTDGSVSALSDIIEYNGFYYLGSPFNNYLGRVKVRSS